MDTTRFTPSRTPPTPAEFVALRAQVGWGELDPVMAGNSLANTLFHVTIREQETLVGMGRVVGDGVLYFYIQDVVVAPGYQGHGIGRMIMDAIEEYLVTATQPGATVGLLAAQGKEGFYTRYGYLERSGDPLGKGMCRFVQ